MKTSRILCSACFNPPKDRLLKSFCSAHPRFLVCNECWNSHKGTQCLQCRKGKILQERKSKQQIDKSPPNYDGNSIGYNAYHLSKGGIDQLYLTQLETEKNLAYAELMNKELEYKQLKEKFDQMVNKLEEHKQSTLYQLKQQQQMQMEGYKQKLQREYLEKEEVRKREIEEQRASLRRQQQQLHNEQRIRQQLSKVQNEKQINRLIIEMTEQRAKFKEEEIRWSRQIQLQKNKLQTLTQQHDKQVVEASERNKRERQQQLESIQNEKRKALILAEAQKRSMCNEYEQKIVKLTASLSAKVSETEEKCIIREQFLLKQKSKLLEQKEHLQEQNKGLSVQLQSCKERLKQQSNRLSSKISDKQTETSKLIGYISRLKDNLEQKQNSVNHINVSIEAISNHMQILTSNIGKTFNEAGAHFQIVSPQRAMLLRVLIEQYNQIQSLAINKQVNSILLNNQEQIDRFAKEESGRMIKLLSVVNIKEWVQNHAGRLKFIGRFRSRLELFKSINNKAIKLEAENQIQPSLKDVISDYLLMLRDRLNRLNCEPIKAELIDQIHYFQQTTQLLPVWLQEHELLKEIQNQIHHFLSWLRERIEFFNCRGLQQQPQQQLSRIEETKQVFKLILNGALKSNFVTRVQKLFDQNYQSIIRQFLIGLKEKQSELEGKFSQLSGSRNYRQSYMMQKVYRQYKSLDVLIGKTEASLHNISFHELYVRYANFLRILKEEKMSLSISLISDDKINVDMLRQEMESISFDEQIRLRYIYRLVRITLNRVNIVQVIGVNEQIKLKQVGMLEQYLRESSKVKQIDQLSSIDEIGVLQRLIGEKMKLVSLYLTKKYQEIYSKMVNFDSIARMKGQCQEQVQVQRFLSTFTPIHVAFNQSIYSKLNINRTQTIHSYFYEYLNVIAEKSQEKAVQIADSSEQTLNQETINLYSNIYDNLDEERQLKLQTKLKNTISTQISRLQFKESKGVIAPDEQQIKIMHEIKHLPQRYISIFRKQIDHRRRVLSEQKLSTIEKEKRRLTPNNFQTLKSLYSNYEINRFNNEQQRKKYADILQSFIQQSYRYSIGSASNQLIFLRNLYALQKGAHCEMIEFMKAKEFGIYFMHIGIASTQRLMNLLQRVQNIQDGNYGATQSTLQEINHIFQLGRVLQQNNAESLLQQAERSEFKRIIRAGKQKIIENVHQLQIIKKIHIFQGSSDRKSLQELFMGLIKIQIYKKIFKSISRQVQSTQLFSLEDDIIERINNEMKEGVKQINRFKFGVSIDGSQEKLKQGLLFASLIFTRFKQVEQLSKHLSDYTKHGYLNQLHFNYAKTSQLANKLQSTWQKQYFNLKADINRQLHHKDLSAHLSTMMMSIQIQKQLVEMNSVNCFKFMLEERFSLDQQGISRLKQEQDRYESNFYRLSEKRHLFLNGIQNIQRQGQQRKKQERSRIVSKYSSLMNEVRNSFHEMASQQGRQMRIKLEVQTLRNQQHTELQNIVEEESKILQEKKARHLVNIQTSIINILEALDIVDKINRIFGPTVRQRATDFLHRVRKDVNNFDKGLVEHIRKHAANIQFNYQILDSKQNQSIANHGGFQQPQVYMQSFIERVKQIGEDQRHLRKACKDFMRQFQRNKRIAGFQYSQKDILQMIKGAKNQMKLLSAPVMLARIHCVFQMILMRKSNIRRDIQLPSSDYIGTIILLLNAYQDNAKINSTIIDLAKDHSCSKMLAHSSIYLALKGYNVFCGNSSGNIAHKIRQQYQQVFCYFNVEQMIAYGQYQSAFKYFLSDGQNLEVESIVKKMVTNCKLSALEQKFIGNIGKKMEQKKQSTILLMSDVQQFYDISFLQGCYCPTIRLDMVQVHRIYELIWKKRASETLKDDIFKSGEVAALKQKYSDLWRLLVNHIQVMINSARKMKELQQIKKDNMELQSNIKWRRVEDGFYFHVFSACSKYQRGLISQQAYRKVLFIPLKIGQLPSLEIPSFFCKILGISSAINKLPPIYSKIMKQKHLVTKLYKIQDLQDPYQDKDIAFRSVREEQFCENIIEKMLALKSSGWSVVVLFEDEKEIDQIYFFKEKIVGQLSNICKINQNTLYQNIVISIEKLYRQSAIILMNSQMLKTLLALLPNRQATAIDIHIIVTSVPKNLLQMRYLKEIIKRNIGCELVISRQKLLKRGIQIQKNNDFYPNLSRHWRSKIDQFQVSEGPKMRVSKQRIQSSMKILDYLSNDVNKFIEAVTKLNMLELENENNKLIIAVQASPLMANALKALINLLKDEILHGVHFTVKILVFRNYHCKYDKMFQSSNFSRAFDYLKTYIESIKLEEYYQQSCYEGLFYQIGKICEYEKIKSLIIIGEGLGNSRDDMIRLRSKFYGEKYWASKLPFLENLQIYGKALLQSNFSIKFLEIVNRAQSDEGGKEETVKSIRSLIQQSYGDYNKMSSDGFENIFNLRVLKQMISSSVASRRE